jgi:hypothetical protein
MPGTKASTKGSTNAKTMQICKSAGEAYGRTGLKSAKTATFLRLLALRGASIDPIAVKPFQTEVMGSRSYDNALAECMPWVSWLARMETVAAGLIIPSRCVRLRTSIPARVNRLPIPINGGSHAQPHSTNRLAFYPCAECFRCGRLIGPDEVVRLCTLPRIFGHR